ncbi:MAG: anti-sigma factor antagonist [Actinobacteria bacterium]|jgi:anti-anti-sigma factor|nr:MAG: anti-sigma factor antagonist [Actinomycetota bacterium]
MAWRVNEIEPGSAKAVVELEGIVDSTNLEDFFAFINSVFKQGFNRIVLDMEFTSYLSSGGLSVIIDAYERAAKEGGKLVIARVSDVVQDLFGVVQFDQIIEFYADLDEAIAAIH